MNRRRGIGIAAAVLVVASLVSGSGSTPGSNARVPALAEAPDAVTAGLLARQQGSRVEIADARTETREVFANPDGTSTAELTAVPKRVKQGNGWVPVDTTVINRPDGTVGPKAAVGNPTFSAGGAEVPLARLTKDGHTLDIWWPKPLPRPELAGNEANYPDVLPGVDLKMIANDTGYEQHLVIKDAKAARNPELARIALRYAAPGLRLSVDAVGTLVADSTNGEEGHVFTAPPPSMWSAGSLRQVRLGVEINDTTLTLTTDQKFLADPATKYPVVIDPVFRTGGWSTWTSVLEGYATSTFPRRSGDGPDVAQVGQCYPDPFCNGIDTARTYVQFDTSFLWGKDVLSATVDSAILHSPNCSGPTQMHWLWKSVGQIGDGTTWANQPNNPADPNIRPLTEAAAPRSNGDWGCPAWQPIGFDAKNAVTPGVTTIMISAQGGQENNGDFWRKYWAKKDPNGDGFQLRVNYNTKPNTPTNLTTDPPLRAPCTWCGGKSYTANGSIDLKAQLSDPDPADQVDTLWQVTKGGVEENPDLLWTRKFQLNGAIHTRNVNLSDPALQDKTVDWWVAAGDGAAGSETAYGKSFVVDRKPPTSMPTVKAMLYGEQKGWRGGVGVPDTFTFEANGVTDVDRYEYDWTDEPQQVAVATGRLSGPASVTLTPPGDGPQTLFVRSVDRAGNRSDTFKYRMYVRAGNGPFAQYSFEGNTEDTAFLGDRDGTLVGGAKYSPGAVGNALLLDGNLESRMTAPNVVRTDTSFSLSAWVRPDELPAGVMGVVSQESAASDPARGSSGWLLNYRDDGQGPKWAFYLQSGDPAKPGWQGPAGRTPQRGKWTHLAAVYDRVANTAQLYVDGVPVGAPYALTAGFVSAQAGGPLAVGRDQWQGMFANPWRGAIDEVQLYDRALSGAEVTAMVSKDNVQVGHWKFEETTGTTAKNSVIGGDAGILTGGAEFTETGAVGRAVRFNGTDGHVITNGPAVRTDQSFSVAAWVRADQLVTTGAMTAVSQDGDANSGFYLQYHSQTKKWTFTKVSTNDDTGVGVPVSAAQAPVAGGWVHLAGVYDATSKQLRIYVNGESGGNPVTYNGTAWTATGPLVIGRSEFHSQQTDYWPGSVDEVRVYSRVLSAEEIKGLVIQNNVTSGSWKFNGTATDDSGRNLGGTIEGGSSWSAGQTAVPDPTDLAIQLRDVSQYVHAKNAVDTSKSFAVSAWARPENPNEASAIVSEDGGFSLTAAANGKWSFRVGPGGVAGSPDDRAEGGAVQYGVWTHVAGVYSKERRTVELYVNGVLITSVPRTGDTGATGEIQFGRAKVEGAYTNHFTGAIDDVLLYNRPLFAEEVRTMAGRDLTLVHNWALDEGAGTAAMDSIGTRTGTLSNGPTYVAGKLGNAIHFDGVNDSVATSAIDLRTDQNFSVSAWIYLDRASCDGGCRKDAVSIDAGGSRNFSKLRLGHIMNDPAATFGYWIFEMPEGDGTVTDAAVRVDAGEVASWVHLTGVYDAASRKIWLYVNGSRADDGTINTPWQSSGGLRIGRATENGAAVGFWPGSVDDVRLYSTLLDKDRVTALYRSYPTNAATAPVPAPDAGYWKLDEGSGTTVADASGRGRTATARGSVTWGHWTGGRAGYAVSLDGSTGYVETAGPVIATNQSFSVTVVAALNNGASDHPVLAQDRTQVSAFQLRYRKVENKYAVIVPSADSPTAPSTVLLSSGETTGNWTHLGVVYDASLRQLKLYVNGRLSAVQVGVSIMDSAGKFNIGKALRGTAADFYTGWLDEVRAYSRALSDGEIRAIHDDIPLQIHGNWTFEGAPTDVSWRNNPTTLSGTTSYVAGKHGQALQLDGISGSATVRDYGVNPLDSFEVSAWVKLSRLDKDSTVLAQDGTRTSGFILQYNKNVGRWVFGAPAQDADGVDLTYTYSPQAPAVNTWTHLVGVYDSGRQQLKLYVNGELAGVRANVKPLNAWGNFTIGRHKANGIPTGFFSGAIDDVRTDIWTPTDAEIRTWATA